MSKLSTTCSSVGIMGQESQGKKARKLQPLAQEQGTTTQWEGAAIHSLWRWLLSSVKARCPLRKDLTNCQGKQTTAGTSCI